MEVEVARFLKIDYDQTKKKYIIKIRIGDITALH